ncbi:hypothetical protein [Trinickia mobilis]|uniref:hypothetical protein n=1 Tax=Trinickia mobilis TaxID=2816356 RepID=UPI001A8FF492|nr:hypothetical protein [Trinickia mobilis]
MQVKTRSVVDEMLSLDWAVAAEVSPLKDQPGTYTLAGLFFPTAYAMGDEWAGDFGMVEVTGAKMGMPDDWMKEEERVWRGGHAYPFTVEDLQFWRSKQNDRFFVSLEVNARELAIVRHMAHLARLLGHRALVGEFSPTDAG